MFDLPTHFSLCVFGEITFWGHGLLFDRIYVLIMSSLWNDDDNNNKNNNKCEGMSRFWGSRTQVKQVDKHHMEWCSWADNLNNNNNRRHTQHDAQCNRQTDRRTNVVCPLMMACAPLVIQKYKIKQ